MNNLGLRYVWFWFYNISLCCLVGLSCRSVINSFNGGKLHWCSYLITCKFSSSLVILSILESKFLIISKRLNHLMIRRSQSKIPLTRIFHISIYSGCPHLLSYFSHHPVDNGFQTELSIAMMLVLCCLLMTHLPFSAVFPLFLTDIFPSFLFRLNPSSPFSLFCPTFIHTYYRCVASR